MASRLKMSAVSSLRLRVHHHMVATALNQHIPSGDDPRVNRSVHKPARDSLLKQNVIKL